MTSPQPEKRGKGLAFYAVVMVIMLPLLYAFSSGPAFWVAYAYGDHDTMQALSDFFLPLDRISRQTGTHKYLQWWMSWRGQSYDPPSRINPPLADPPQPP